MENLDHQTDYDDFLKPSKMQIFWTIVMWLGLIATLIWATLKALGYIHSPAWQEALPFFTAVAAVGGGIFALGIMLGDIRRTLRFIRRDSARQETRLGTVETTVQGLRSDFKELRTDFDAHTVRYHSRRA